MLYVIKFLIYCNLLANVATKGQRFAYQNQFPSHNLEYDNQSRKFSYHLPKGAVKEWLHTLQRGKRSVSGTAASDYLVFRWDKDVYSAYEYHLNICTDRCFNGQLIKLNSTLGCPNIYCVPCDCDRPHCQIYDTCCPDLLEVSRLFPSQLRLLQVNDIQLVDSDWLSQSSGNISSRVENCISSSPNETACADLQPNNTQVDSEVVELWSQQGPRLVCREENVGPSYLHIRACPEGHGNETQRTGCEVDVGVEGQSMLRYQYVTDSTTGVSYFNALCAACNNVATEMMLPWGMEIQCHHFMHVYEALNRDTFLRLSLKPGSTCTVYQVPPTAEEISSIHNSTTTSDSSIRRSFTKCTHDWFDSLYSSCNVTGRWEHYDAEIEAACINMDHPTLKVFDFRQNRDTYFKNIFCAICNTGQYPWFYDECKDEYDDGEVPVKSLPFSLLLGTRSRSPMRKVLYSPFATCLPSQWAGPDGRCYPLRCSAGKVVDQDNKDCKTALPSIGGLGYSLNVYYLVKPKSEISFNNSLFTVGESVEGVIDLYLDAFRSKIWRTMYSLSASGELFFTVITVVKNLHEINYLIGDGKEVQPTALEHPSVLYPILIGMNSRFTDNSDLGRDDFEKAVVSELLHTDLEVTVTDDHTLVLTPETVLEGYGAFMDCSYVNYYFEGLKCSSGRLIRLAFGLNPNDVWATSDRFLPLTPHLNCPYVVLNNTQYGISSDLTQIPPSFTVKLNFAEIQFNFTLPFERNMLMLDTDNLIVCHDILQTKVSEMSLSYYLVADEDDEAVLLSQYILTMVCQILSILCLIFTLLTYFIFSTLRSAAGMNNIFLCLSLVCAQIFLLAASHVNSSGVFCTALAISTHFLWLCMFCWSFACCFHMYRIFTAKTRNTGGSSKSRSFEFGRKSCLCALAPALVITAVVVTHMLLHDEIGYGKDGCFLDTGLLIWLAVIVPLGFVLVCNMFFFCSTVMKIYSVRKLQSGENVKKDERRNLYIYIKLSTITGGFWVVSIIAETLDIEPLRYVSIVLNGLQGVFIFISYIANRRVLNMYRRALGLQEQLPSGSTSTDRSTLAKEASFVHKQGKPSANEPSPSPAPTSKVPRQTSVESGDSGCRDGSAFEGEDEPAREERGGSG